MTVNSKVRALRQQAGYTLVELSIAVAIVSVLIITGLVGVPRILDTNRVSTLAQQVSIANANYSKLAASTTGNNAFATTPTYTNGIALALASMDVWPEENITRTAANVPWSINHAWGDAIHSRNVTVPLGNFLAPDGGYIVKLDNIPAKSCFALASAFGGTALQVTIENGAAPVAGPVPASETPAGTIAKAAGSALNINTLSTACQTSPGVAKNIHLWFQY